MRPDLLDPWLPATRGKDRQQDLPKERAASGAPKARWETQSCQRPFSSSRQAWGWLGPPARPGLLLSIKKAAMPCLQCPLWAHLFSQVPCQHGTSSRFHQKSCSSTCFFFHGLLKILHTFSTSPLILSLPCSKLTFQLD